MLKTPVKERIKPRPPAARPAIQYRCEVRRYGYEWRAASGMCMGRIIVRMGQALDLRVQLSEERQADWALAPVVVGAAEPPLIVKSLDEKPDLYLDFCSLKPSQDPIRKFADEFGLLGLREDEGRVYPPSGLSLACELQSDWRNQILALNEAAELWRMIRDAREGNPAELERHIHWDEDLTAVRWIEEPGAIFGSLIAHHMEQESRIWKMLHQDPTISPAFYRLMELLEKHGGLSVKLDVGTSASQLDPDSLGLFFYPENLLTCLWLQLAQAVASRRRIRRCLSWRWP
jgi:hypothetical protein